MVIVFGKRKSCHCSIWSYLSNSGAVPLHDEESSIWCDRNSIRTIESGGRTVSIRRSRLSGTTAESCHGSIRGYLSDGVIVSVGDKESVIERDCNSNVEDECHRSL